MIKTICQQRQKMVFMSHHIIVMNLSLYYLLLLFHLIVIDVEALLHYHTQDWKKMVCICIMTSFTTTVKKKDAISRFKGMLKSQLEMEMEQSYISLNANGTTECYLSFHLRLRQLF